MRYDFYITGTIGEEFDWWTGQSGTTSAQVKHFLDDHKDEEVTIAVSSPGGYLDEGITIAEMIADHGKCNMVIIGMTASSATVLCMKAKSVKIARGSLMLIHNCSQYVFGQGMSNKKKIEQYIESLKKTREELDTIDKAIADFYSFRNGKTIEENCSMMDQGKWMTAQEAVDFGIVDSILEDEDSQKQTKAIQNVYASFNGIEDHFHLPKLPVFDSPEPKVPRGIMAKLRNIFNDFRGVVEDDTANEITPTNITDSKMKKIILNLICAILAVQDITVGEKGEAQLTEDQLNKLEKALKEKDDRITELENEKQAAIKDKETAENEKTIAEQAKSTAEQNLATLQKEFDDFKAQAGDDTHLKPAQNKDEAVTSSSMFNAIKNIL